MTIILNQLRDKEAILILNSGMNVPGTIGPTDEMQGTVEVTSRVPVQSQEQPSDIQVPHGQKGGRVQQSTIKEVKVFVRIASIDIIQPHE